MAIPLEVTLLLHKLKGWRFARFPDGDGNDRLYFCLPMLENGIIALDRSNKKSFDATSRTKAVFMKFRAIPSVRKKKSTLYSFALSLPCVYYNTLINLGMQPQDWHRQAVGNIKKWRSLQERRERDDSRKRRANKSTCS